jgi:HK97 family phage portal protein
MGIISKITNSVKSALTGWEAPLNQVIAAEGLSTDSGQLVSVGTASRVATLTAGINLLANDVSSLPLNLMLRTPNGPKYAVEHPLFRLLSGEWNPELTAREGMEHSIRMLLMTGNFFNYLQLDASGNVQAIWPLYAPNVTGRRLTDYEMRKLGLNPETDSNLAWDYSDSAKIKTYHDSQMWRASMYGKYALVGEGLVSIGKHTIGTAIAAEKAGARLFKKGTLTDVYFQPEPGGDLSKEEWLKLSAAWERGADGSFTKPIIPEKIKVNTLQVPTAQQAQFIERLKRQDLEICRLLNIPASILDADEKGAPFAASESQRRWYVSHSLRPYLTLIEQSINARCLGKTEKGVYYAEFDADALVSADQQARYAANKESLGGASFKTINEVRRDENLPAVPGGDTLLIPVNNLAPLGKDGKVTPPQQPKPSSYLQALAKVCAERVVRKETKSQKFDAAFVEEVMCIPAAKAQSYCDKRTSGQITDADAVAALMSLALEETNNE